MKFMESKLWSYGEKLYDLLIINLLWLIFSIPIITIGPATYAGLNVINEIENGSSKSIFIIYIKYFKENFINNMLAFNTLVGFLLIGIYGILNGIQSMNLIIIFICSFIIIECVLSISVLFFINKLKAIDLIVESFIQGNKICPKIILNLCLCIIVLFLGMTIPLLIPTLIGLCLFISYKNLYNISRKLI